LINSLIDTRTTKEIKMKGLPLLQPDRQSDIQKIQKVLEGKMIVERLKAFGFTQDEIQGVERR